MLPDKLVMMANQIGCFFATQRGDAAADVAAHITRFWDPRMREAFLDYVEASGGFGLSDITRGAARHLRPEATEPRRKAASAA